MEFAKGIYAEALLISIISNAIPAVLIFNQGCNIENIIIILLKIVHFSNWQITLAPLPLRLETNPSFKWQMLVK